MKQEKFLPYSISVSQVSYDQDGLLYNNKIKLNERQMQQNSGYSWNEFLEEIM